MKIMPELTEPIPQEPYNSESITSQADVLTDQSIPETPKPENSSVNSILSRRQFLRLAGGAAAATVLASAAGPVVASRAITSLLDPTSSISEDNVTPTPLAPEVTVNPNDRIKEFIGINPTDFEFTDGIKYTGTIDVEPPQGKPIIVHFGQSHGRNDFVGNVQNMLSIDTIAKSQEAIEKMILESNTKHIFDEGVDDKLLGYLSFVREQSSGTLASIQEHDPQKWNTLTEGYIKIREALVVHLGFDLDTFKPSEAIFGGNLSGDIKYYYYYKAHSALDFLLLQTARRLNAGTLPLPKQSRKDSSKDEFTFEYLDDLNATSFPYMDLGAAVMLFLNNEISLYPGESPSYFRNIGFTQALFRIAVTKLNQDNISEEDRRKAEELIAKINKQTDLNALTPRETSVLKTIHSSDPFNQNENIGIVYGSAHDFSEEFKDEFPPGTAGLITIKPKL